MFAVVMDYPTPEEEAQIALVTTAGPMEVPRSVMSGPDVLRLQQLVRQVAVGETVLSFATRLVRRTRPADDTAPDFIRKWVQWGAGPSRHAGSHRPAGKARALLHGRLAVSREDVRALALSVLRHRVIPSFAAEAEGVSADDIVARLLEGLRE